MKIIEPQNAKFVAEISGVKELRLIGRADLHFWNKHLSGNSFQAFAAENGCAEITVGATELVWKRFRFNELTVSLAVADESNARKQIGYFLLHAFNSNRFFAFCERVFFSTPYFFGTVNLKETTPASLAVWSDNQLILKAGMNKFGCPPSEVGDDWEGTVFLPRGKYFAAKLSGKSKVCPFSESDKLELNGDGKFPVFDRLTESNFAPREWRMRSDAFHAKSKTYRY